MINFLEDRHPWIVAERRFLAGEITRLQAAGMVATDREFIAEVELRGGDPVAEARRVVREVWTPRLVLASAGCTLGPSR